MLSPHLKKRLTKKIKIQPVDIPLNKPKTNPPKHQYYTNMLDKLPKNKKKLIVFVLKKSRDYDIDYVQKLVDSLKNNISVDVEIVGLSDTDISNYATWIKFEHDWSGWWSKMELFSHPYLRGEDIIYFDLDTVINKNIDSLIQHKHNFTMLRDFYSPQRYGSGLMAWSGDRKYITDKFVRNAEHYMKTYKTSDKWGDQGFIRDHVNDKIEIMQDIPSIKIGSYKVTKDRKSCDIICFHGRPRPRSVGWRI